MEPLEKSNRCSVWARVAHILIPIILPAGVGAADDPPPSVPALAAQLQKLDARAVLPEGDKPRQLADMLSRHLHARLQEANQREASAFEQIKTQAEWDRFRTVRLQALRESLGSFPPVPEDLKVRTTGTINGDGYQIDKLAFESRPGLVVTANLYRPAPLPRSMPGILIVHSFFHPKSQPELQDMGVNWARLGCLVLVPDLLGHGERRQHPFVDSKSYPEPFTVARQDYFSRANTGTQLSLIGESLMGWMVWDLMRCVDVLFNRPGIDKERVLLLGAVAGGADPAAVAAALDPRIAAVVPFNFGGPEPETPHPLPADAEKIFPYALCNQWDATRRLRNSARDGFVPWVIIGSVAPRRLIYAHEFVWDREHDPVWPRLQKVYELSGTRDHLAFVQGYGLLSSKPEESSGCANIGAALRKPMYPIFQRWFDMPGPDKEVLQRRSAEDLFSITPEVAANLKPRQVHQIAADLGAERSAAAGRRLATLKPEARRQQLRRDWNRLLGEVAPATDLQVTQPRKESLGDVTAEWLVLEVEPQVVVPLVLLLPPRKEQERLPVVVAVAQHGKQEFLRQRATTIAELLRGGTAVCLPDVRGTGETRPAGDHRGPPTGSRKTVAARSEGTLLAAGAGMLGSTLLGERLRDLRSVARHLRSRADLDPARMAFWGDSFAPVNPADRRLEVPWDAERTPDQAEPLGGLLALLGGLFEDNVRAVAVRGGLISYASVLESPFCYVPHDALVPAAVPAGDLVEVAATLAPRPLRMEGFVDGRNRRLAAELLAKTLEPVERAYRVAGKPDHFSPTPDPDTSLGQWLLKTIQ
jgi:cephalosporin-C deacetylase-like acetyl esterase